MSKRIVVGVIAVVLVVTFFAFLRFGGELVVTEYLKLLHFFLLEQFQIGRN